MQRTPFDTIDAAIADLKAGRLVIVVDDEDRENEGDFVGVAETITADQVNFMATVGKGLICVPMTAERTEALELPVRPQRNMGRYDTAFTDSVDHRRRTSTGISAADRAATIRALADPGSRPEDFARPGHVFPIRAIHGGVLRRTGHTEAAVDLCKIAGFQPVGTLVEILNEDGTMARRPELSALAQRHGMCIITISDLVAYRMQRTSLIERSVTPPCPQSLVSSG